MRVLIADKFPEPYIDQIRGLGSQVVYEPKFGAAEIVQAISDKDIVVVRSTKVTAEAIEATQNLSLIIRAGAGTNNIDKQAVGRKRWGRKRWGPEKVTATKFGSSGGFTQLLSPDNVFLHFPNTSNLVAVTFSKTRLLKCLAGTPSVVARCGGGTDIFPSLRK